MLIHWQPTGVAGLTGATGIAFALLGCWNQLCYPSGCPAQIPLGAVPNYGFDSTSTFGGYNSTLTGSSSANIDAQCASICILKNGANYFGTVNNSTSSPFTGDCYCGSAITGTAATAGIEACQICGGQTVGQCGVKASTLAVYARAF